MAPNLATSRIATKAAAVISTTWYGGSVGVLPHLCSIGLSLNSLLTSLAIIIVKFAFTYQWKIGNAMQTF